MKVQRGFKTEIKPNDRQKTLLLKNAGAARWAYNWGLNQKKIALEAKTKIPNNIELHRHLNELKKSEIPWAYECSKCSFQEALRNLDSLTKNKSAVGIEDLNVAGMLRNRCLARSIADLGLGEWRRQMTYKGVWYKCRIVVADRFFASSKTCSVCGEINENLTLADREWDCEGCGTHHDRDFNASSNLEYVAASSTETKNACVV